MRMLAAMFDITDRRRAEEALRRSEAALRLSEERYALAMDASEEGHFDWNVRRDEIFASEHLKKLLDLPSDVPLRTRDDMVSRMPFFPGDGERVAQMAREVLGGDACKHEFEYRLGAGAGRGAALDPRALETSSATRRGRPNG
jgi:PAS domain-containing protein